MIVFFSAVERHSGYIVAVPGKKSKIQDKKEKYGATSQLSFAATLGVSLFAPRSRAREAHGDLTCQDCGVPQPVKRGGHREANFRELP